MPKYTSQIKSEESAKKVNSLIANFLAAQGYKPTANKKGNEWRKGFYWFKYAGYGYSQGIINIEVWNYCPYPGLGSFLMYFIGIEELKKLLKDLEEMLSRKSSLQDASQTGAAEFQGDTAGDAIAGNRKEAGLQVQAVPVSQKKTVVGFAKVWIGFLIIGNLAATCAPINQLTIPGASEITAIVMLLSGAIAAGYIMLYNKNPFGLYLVLIANLLALSMNSPSVLVKTGLIPGIITFFITYKQIAYPFGKPAVTKANLNPTISDNLVVSRQQNTNSDGIAPETVPESKPAPTLSATASAPLPETQTPALQKQPEAAEYVNQGGQNETSTLNAVSVNAHSSASPVLHSSTPIKRPRLPVWGWACIIAVVMGCLFLTGIAGLVGVRWALSGSSQQTSAAPTQSPAIQMPGVISTATNERIPQEQELQATKEPVAGLPGSSVPAIAGSISPQNINQVSEEAHTEENPQDGPLFCHQVAWSLDNERIAIASNNVHIFDFRTGKEEVTITGLQWVDSIVSSPDGKTLATSSGSAGIQLWDPISNTEIRDFPQKAESGKKLAISPDGTILAATTDSGFTLFDVETGKQILQVANVNGPYNLAFSPDGKILAGGGAELRLWNVKDGHEIQVLKGGGPP